MERSERNHGPGTQEQFDAFMADRSTEVVPDAQPVERWAWRVFWIIVAAVALLILMPVIWGIAYWGLECYEGCL